MPAHGGAARADDLLTAAHRPAAHRGSGGFNAWLAVKITDGVGTMWCAYLFAALALIGLPAALRPGGAGAVSWSAQTFLQLVLLSIILVGQNIAAASSEARSEINHQLTYAILDEIAEIRQDLCARDQLCHAARQQAVAGRDPLPGVDAVAWADPPSPKPRRAGVSPTAVADLAEQKPVDRTVERRELE